MFESGLTQSGLGFAKLIRSSMENRKEEGAAQREQGKQMSD